MAESPDLRFLLLPLPEFALLPFGGFLDKLRFSADDEDYSRQRYCTGRFSACNQGMCCPAAVLRCGSRRRRTS